MDWAGFLKRTFDFNVLACARGGGRLRLKGLGVREGREGSASDTGAPVLAHGRYEPGPGARVNPGRVVLRLTPPQSQKAQSPTAHPMGARPGQEYTPRGCAASPPAWLTARAAPPAALLGTSPPALTLHMDSLPPIRIRYVNRRLAHVVCVSGLVLFWSQETGFGPEMRAQSPFSEGGALKAAGCSAWRRRQSNPPLGASGESAAPGGVRAILEHLALPTLPGRLAPARGPTQNSWF